MSEVVNNSSDAFNLIHKSLAGWLTGSLDEFGFEDEPDLYLKNLMEYARVMREIEDHTDIVWPSDGGK